MPDALHTERRYCKALWNNRAEWCSETDEAAIIELINNVDDFIYQNAALDRQDPDSNAAWDLRDDLAAEYNMPAEKVICTTKNGMITLAFSFVPNHLVITI